MTFISVGRRRLSSPGAGTSDNQSPEAVFGVDDQDSNCMQSSPNKRGPCERLQTELLRAREELVEARNQLIKVTAKWMQCETDLRREREVNELAREYIPEDQKEEFLLACPCRQPMWEDYSHDS